MVRIIRLKESPPQEAMIHQYDDQFMVYWLSICAWVAAFVHESLEACACGRFV